MSSSVVEIPFDNGAVYREDLAKQYFVGPGASILTKPIQPDVIDISSYHYFQHGMQDEMHKVLNYFAKEVSTWRRKAKVVLAEPKSWESIQRNMVANASYFDVSQMDTGSYQFVNEGLIATILDMHRGSIFTDGVDQAIELGNILTPKAAPEQVVSVQDGWTQRHVINNLPRQQIIYNLGGVESGTRYYGEIMVFPKEMEKCYKDTRPMYSTDQQLTDYFNSANCAKRANVRRVSQLYSFMSPRRIKMHERVRRESGIIKLVLDMEKDVKCYVKIDERTGRDQYFYTMPDMYENGRLNALRVDFEKNINISDPSLLRHVNDKEALADGSVINVPLREFRMATAYAMKEYNERKFGMV